CMSPNSMNPGVWLQGQVVVQTATPPARMMRSAVRPRRIFLVGAACRLTGVSVIFDVPFERSQRPGVPSRCRAFYLVSVVGITDRYARRDLPDGRPTDRSILCHLMDKPVMSLGEPFGASCSWRGPG